MKKHSAISGLLLLTLLSACSQQGKSSETDTAATTEAAVDTAMAADTLASPNIPFKVKEFEKAKGDNKLKIEYPVEGNPALVESVRKWISEQLTGTYRGNLDDPGAFFRHYAAQLGEDPDLNEVGGFTQDEFELEYTNDYIVTYDYTSYVYEGGAHGMGGEYGTTFLQSDGTIFTKKCFSNYTLMHDLFIDGLKKYFKVRTDKELLECLIGVDSLAKLSPPGMDPWIEEDGIVFSYTPYEIAPYSSGSPRFTIPIDDAAPYLTAEGRKFIGK